MDIYTRMSATDELIGDIAEDIRSSAPQRRVSTVISLCKKLIDLKKKHVSLFAVAYPINDEHIRRAVDTCYLMQMSDNHETKKSAAKQAEKMLHAMCGINEVLKSRYSSKF